MFSPPPCGDSFFDDMEELPSTLASFKEKSPSTSSNFTFKKPQGFAAGSTRTLGQGNNTPGLLINTPLQTPKLLRTVQNAEVIDCDFDDDIDLEGEIERERNTMKSGFKTPVHTSANTQNISTFDSELDPSLFSTQTPMEMPRKPPTNAGKQSVLSILV